MASGSGQPPQPDINLVRTRRDLAKLAHQRVGGPSGSEARDLGRAGPGPGSSHHEHNGAENYLEYLGTIGVVDGRTATEDRVELQGEEEEEVVLDEEEESDHKMEEVTDSAPMGSAQTSRKAVCSVDMEPGGVGEREAGGADMGNGSNTPNVQPLSRRSSSDRERGGKRRERRWRSRKRCWRKKRCRLKRWWTPWTSP